MSTEKTSITEWCFLARDATGGLALCGSFVAEDLMSGADLKNGVCWDSRHTNLNVRGAIEGRFMKSPEKAGVRLAWWVLRLSNAGIGGQQVDEKEPYSGVAVVKSIGSDGLPAMLEGEFREITENRHGGKIVFIRKGTEDWERMPPEMRCLFVKQ